LLLLLLLLCEPLSFFHFFVSLLFTPSFSFFYFILFYFPSFNLPLFYTFFTFYPPTFTLGRLNPNRWNVSSVTYFLGFFSSSFYYGDVTTALFLPFFHLTGMEEGMGRWKY